MFVDDVAAHAVGRADIVLRRKVGEGPPEILKEPLVSHGDANPHGAPFPNTHEPDGVEALIGDRIPLLVRDRGEIQAPPVLAAQIVQPHPRVHFVDDGMLGPGLHFFVFSGVHRFLLSPQPVTSTTKSALVRRAARLPGLSNSRAMASAIFHDTSVSGSIEDAWVMRVDF